MPPLASGIAPSPAEKARKKGGASAPPFERHLFLFKNVLTHPAGGADPTLGDLFPGSSGGDAVFRVAYRRIIDIAARAYILIHANHLA